jgi:hypothetical protein
MINTERPDEIRPFRIEVPLATLDDLRARLRPITSAVACNLKNHTWSFSWTVVLQLAM